MHHCNDVRTSAHNEKKKNFFSDGATSTRFIHFLVYHCYCKHELFKCKHGLFDCNRLPLYTGKLYLIPCETPPSTMIQREFWKPNSSSILILYHHINLLFREKKSSYNITSGSFFFFFFNTCIKICYQYTWVKDLKEPNQTSYERIALKDIQNIATPENALQIVLFVMLCPIWYHLYNFKNVINTHRGVLLSVQCQIAQNASFKK